MRTDRIGDPGASGEAAHDPPSGVPVKTPPVAIEKDRTLRALADGQIDRPGGVRRQRYGDDLAALRRMVRVRWPRSRPSASMSAPNASETRSPLIANSDTSACSAGPPRPAATSSAPTSVRSRPTAWDS
jgi:hypothetical protein